MKIFIMILTPFVIVLTVFQFISFDKQWYIKEFDKLGVYGGLGRERVNAEANNVFDYLRGKEELDENFYTKKELFHLADVRSLFVKVKWINILFISTFGIISFFIIKKKGIREFLRNVFWSGVFSFVFFIFLFLLGFLFFDPLFYLFHKISFVNDFWLLDPSIEYLVVIFPQQIFLDLVLRVFFISIIISIILSAIIGVSRFKEKTQT